MTSDPKRWRRVLLPLDGTPVAEQVMALVAPIARDADEVHLLRAVSTTGDGGVAAREEAGRYLERMKAGLAARGGRAKILTAVRAGDPVVGILGAAGELEPDLVAMATKGQTTAASRAYGSVTEQVVRRCPFPTLVADPLRHRADGKSVRRILVPFDGSPAAATCLPLIVRVATSYNAQVDLVHVKTTGDERHDAVDPHRRRLEQAGVVSRAVVLPPGAKSVAARLIEEIERADADLVIISTGGRDGVVRWALGPTAEGVLRGCRRPLLIRPVPAQAAGAAGP